MFLIYLHKFIHTYRHSCIHHKKLHIHYRCMHTSYGHTYMYSSFDNIFILILEIIFVSHLLFEGKNKWKKKLLDVSYHEVKESHSNHSFRFFLIFICISSYIHLDIHAYIKNSGLYTIDACIHHIGMDWYQSKHTSYRHTYMHFLFDHIFILILEITFVSHLLFEGKNTRTRKLLDVSYHEVKESRSNPFLFVFDIFAKLHTYI